MKELGFTVFSKNSEEFPDAEILQLHYPFFSIRVDKEPF
jgi:hypothetical protein